MQLNPVARAVLVVFYLVTSIALAAILGFFLYSLIKLNEKLESLEGKINPLLVKTEEILTLTNEKIVSLGKRTDSILTHGEAVAEGVHDKVDRTATSVQRTVNAPIIGLNSIAVGLMHGLQTFSLLQRKPTGKLKDIEIITGEPVSGPPLNRYTDLTTPTTVDSTVNSNGALVALSAGKGN